MSPLKQGDFPCSVVLNESLTMTTGSAVGGVCTESGSETLRHMPKRVTEQVQTRKRRCTSITKRLTTRRLTPTFCFASPGTCRCEWNEPGQMLL